MFPFWESVIAPVLRAADCKRIVEIGALRGETTTLLLDDLGPDARLHVIDPLPQFDPAEHERKLPGRYIFHRSTSHEVLPGLEPMDGALIDGDHNWHTVHRELELLAEVSNRAGAMLPVMIMHDVLWPYGKRDLYYEPDRIPEAERQPFRRAGMRPGSPELFDGGGINAALANAISEGGPRNGVMKALEDFQAEHPEPLRVIVLPIYFGLAIVAEERRLAASPKLAAEFDRLESAELRHELLELAESLRLEAVLAEQTVAVREHSKLERSAARYLRSVRAALIDGHNLENELRLQYLEDCRTEKRPVHPIILRDPALHLADDLSSLESARNRGVDPADGPQATFFPYARSGRVGLGQLQQCLHKIRTEEVPGDLADCGTGRGGEAILLRAYVEAYEMPGRAVWVLDEFRSPEAPDPDPLQTNRMADINMVRRGFDRFELLDEGVRFVPGEVAARLAQPPFSQLALLRVDGDRVRSVADVLDRGYPLVADGGFVVVDGAENPQTRAAVEDLRARLEVEDEASDDGRRISWRKSAQPVASETPEAAHADPSDRPYVATIDPDPGTPYDLSMVVVFHNMRREAERTLRSLTRTYQQGIDELDYEVIVVDNGSTPDQNLGEEFVASFGPEFRYLDLGDSATPSPAAALNRGLEIARGGLLGMMIDGAHVLSPGVLRYAVLGAKNHAPAMVSTQQWYVGPGQQVETVNEGYDRAYEDRLFEQISWPDDGYRLFEISHLIGSRDWFDGMLESNCLFVPRSVLAQVGAWDESFSMPASGFANLDFYERIANTPGVNPVTIVGEGSFHQLHGGTTTNAIDREARERLLERYQQHYLALRGRPYRPSHKPYHYVGSMSALALRTRTRRGSADAFSSTADQLSEDRRPDVGLPLAQDLEKEFTEAYWRSMRWRTTSWLGHSVPMPPADLLAYQQLIVEGKPRWVIEIGGGDGGRAAFLASICDLIDHGEVISIGPRREGLPEHPRVTYLEGAADEEAAFERVREITGGERDAIVIFGIDARDTLLRGFELYSPLVPIDSWIVIEETIMNGHPIWPGMGLGPADAVSVLRRQRLDFEPDLRMERLTPSFNPSGYLRRIRD